MPKGGFFNYNDNNMTTPIKYDWMIKFRRWLDGFVMEGVPLPNINPDIISAMSVFTAAVAFMYRGNLAWIFIFLLVSLLLDWIDGVVARKYNRVSRHGYWVDMICDRLVELMIAIYSPMFWLPMFSINFILTFVNLKTKVHLMLPIRAAFLLFLLFKIFGIDFGWI